MDANFYDFIKLELPGLK